MLYSLSDFSHILINDNAVVPYQFESCVLGCLSAQTDRLLRMYFSLFKETIVWLQFKSEFTRKQKFNVSPKPFGSSLRFRSIVRLITHSSVFIKHKSDPHKLAITRVSLFRLARVVVPYLWSRVSLWCVFEIQGSDKKVYGVQSGMSNW